MIGIVGASGMIGSSIKEYFESLGEQVIGTYNKNKIDGLYRYDIGGEYDGIFDACDTVIISGSINNIDECASNPDLSDFINVKKTIELIDTLCNANKKIIFLSSDQVFDGKDGGYSEDDTPNPVNTYGKQKLIVEQYIREHHQENSVIIRLSKTYSEDLNKVSMYSQIVDKLRKNETIKCATDQVFNLTEVTFVANAINAILQRGFIGTIHLASKDVVSRYDFALQIANNYGFNKELIKAASFDSLGLHEKRGLNSWLKTDRLCAYLNGFM